MSDEQRRADSLDELTGDLRTAVERLKNRPPPEAAIERALSRAGCCKATQRLRRASWRFAALGLAAATAATIVIGLWLMRSTDSWADVVEAVQTKPWIHGVRRNNEFGGHFETWFSAAGDKNASATEQQITFFDHRSRIILQYDLNAKILYRVLAPKNSEAGIRDLSTLFRQMFRGDAHLHGTFGGAGLKDQQRAQIKKDGRDWDQFDLQFEEPSRANFKVSLSFVVDPKTHLPHSLTMGLGNQGHPLNIEFDYPQTGPADIYALGVPKDARVVDSDPNGNLASVRAGIQKSRNDLDDYHAIVVQNNSPDLLSGAGHRTPIVYLVWKKGERYRVEVIRSPAQFVPGTLPAKKDEPAWVREACRKSQFKNLEVYNGRFEYEGNKFTQHVPQSTAAGNDALRATLAEWAYPCNLDSHMGLFAIDPKTGEGPTNTVLLTWHSMGVRPRGVISYNFERFWIDPARSYAAVRHDILQDQPAAKPPSEPDFKIVMDRLQKSPKGIWYPTRVSYGLYLKNTKQPAMCYHFFVDFPTDMPESLFKPVKRTVLTDRYPVSQGAEQSQR